MNAPLPTKTDLPSRLRNWASWEPGQINRLCMKAADELQLTRKALHKHVCGCGDPDLDPAVHDIQCAYRLELLP